jgi:hypothetical protein
VIPASAPADSSRATRILSLRASNRGACISRSPQSESRTAVSPRRNRRSRRRRVMEAGAWRRIDEREGGRGTESTAVGRGALTYATAAPTLAHVATGLAGGWCGSGVVDWARGMPLRAALCKVVDSAKHLRVGEHRGSALGPRHNVVSVKRGKIDR